MINKFYWKRILYKFMKLVQWITFIICYIPSRFLFHTDLLKFITLIAGLIRLLDSRFLLSILFTYTPDSHCITDCPNTNKDCKRVWYKLIQIPSLIRICRVFNLHDFWVLFVKEFSQFFQIIFFWYPVWIVIFNPI